LEAKDPKVKKTRSKTTPIGALNKKTDAVVKASKKTNLESIVFLEDEDGYDSELDENASLRENACMGNIFVM
jgi:hypothetical protein